MKGDEKILEYLNKALKMELASVNQYFLHSRMFNNWGLHRLGKKEYEESIEEMQHADRLIQRILFLEGLPNLQTLDKLYIGENVKDCLEGDLKAEKRGHPFYKEAIAYCEEISDFVTRELFTNILENEEEHIDWLETQLDLIARIGLERYTQSQIGE